MKLIYLHQYFRTPEMSGGTRSYEMARRLVARGHEVQMITTWSEPSRHRDWFESEVDGIHVHWLPVPYHNRMSYPERMKAFFAFALRASARARGLDADIVFATSTPLTIAIPAVRVARALRVPMVFEVRDLWPEMPIAIGALRNPVLRYAARKLEEFAYANAAHVVALSPGMRDGVVRVTGNEQGVTVIPNACDLGLFDPQTAQAAHFLAERPELAGARLVTYAGTFGRVNGASYLARIAEACSAIDGTLKFVAVGGGHEEKAMAVYAREAGVLGRNFFMYPALAKRQMPALLKASTLSMSLFIDIEEMQVNSANKFFDALAAGNPVCINYGGWQADLIRRHGIGIVVPPDDPTAAASLIVEFLADAERVEAAGRRARELARELFDRDRLARDLEDVLARALNQGSAPLQPRATLGGD